MSRIGNRILEIPANVEVKVENNIVSVKGPKGELSTEVNKNITVEVKDNTVVVTRTSDEFKNFHGTTNANIKNMIKGVTEGFEKKLEAVGSGSLIFLTFAANSPTNCLSAAFINNSVLLGDSTVIPAGTFTFTGCE